MEIDSEIKNKAILAGFSATRYDNETYRPVMTYIIVNDDEKNEKLNKDDL